MQDDCYYLTQTTSDLNLAPLLEFGFIIYPEHILETGETCQRSAEFFYFIAHVLAQTEAASMNSE